MGYNLEGKAANSGPWCQLTLVTGWVKGKLGGHSRRVDHYISLEPATVTDPAGAVFMKGLSQVLDLSWLYFYTKVKPKTWLRPFVNTAPDFLLAVG